MIGGTRSGIRPFRGSIRASGRKRGMLYVQGRAQGICCVKGSVYIVLKFAFTPPPSSLWSANFKTKHAQNFRTEMWVCNLYNIFLQIFSRQNFRSDKVMSLLCHFYAAINQSAKWSPARTKSKSRPCYNLQVYKRGPRSSWETTRAISRNHEPFFHGALYGPPAGETSDQIRQCCRCTTCGIWLTHSLTHLPALARIDSEKRTRRRPLVQSIHWRRGKEKEGGRVDYSRLVSADLSETLPGIKILHPPLVIRFMFIMKESRKEPGMFWNWKMVKIGGKWSNSGAANKLLPSLFGVITVLLRISLSININFHSHRWRKSNITWMLEIVLQGKWIVLIVQIYCQKIILNPQLQCNYTILSI